MIFTDRNQSTIILWITITKIKTLRMVDKPSQWLPSEAESHHSQGQKTIAKVEKKILGFYTVCQSILLPMSPVDTDAYASIGNRVILESGKSWFTHLLRQPSGCLYAVGRAVEYVTTV